MIRFVDISEALANDENDVKAAFSFFDTVTDKYIELDGEVVFDSEDHLRICHSIESGLIYTHPVERLIWVIPDKYFEAFDKRKKWDEYKRIFNI